MRRIWVDFNDIEDGVTITLRKFAQGTPYRGEVVRAVDDDGDSCWATVIEIHGEVVHLLLDLPRFEHAESKR